MKKRFLRLLILAVTAAFVWAAPNYAASSVQADHVALSIAIESPAKPGTTIWAAIRQVIAPGWHTYWRNPGDSGLATSISWVLPKGVIAGEPRWPTPERFTTGPIVNYGYTAEATLLVPLTVEQGAVVGPAQAKLFLLECAQMCIPEQVTLDLDLHRASPKGFAAAQAAIPRPFPGAAHIAVSTKTVTLTLTSPALSNVKVGAIRFYPATTRAVNYDLPSKVSLSGNTLTWEAPRPSHVRLFWTFDGVLDAPGAGAFTVSAMPVAIVTAVPAAAAVGSPAATDDLTLVEATLMAFWGGLLLNLMPCVLPILSMKALALAQAGGSSSAMRRDGVFYFGGALATFAAIGGSLLLLKAGGAALGWGFQLQSPIVVFMLALLMAAIGLNLLGAFEVPLSLAGIGNDLTRAEGGQGAFFTGALAVLVASPCTAPFMGTALGFALTQPAASAIAVFLALGIGFALPFSALAFTPALIRLVPKPGPWMIRFKEFLAFPMFATAIWLLWVLCEQVGSAGLAVALSAGLGVVFLMWLLPLLRPWPRRATGLAGAAALIALSFQLRPVPAQSATSWAPWSAEAVAEARRAGKPVLVDFSAAWCVTCLVNERVALEDAAVTARLQRDGVVTLKGDWTNRNPAITAELNRYDRGGVPLYLLYPPASQGQAVLLPQILTPGFILGALNRVEAARRP
ncbi:MAG: thioredoxin family protein [Alphaproteobacteria bacterium]|nr:thioredoxin family protein [Alphaproteobacteria bacterium]MDE2492732.1 thioredoxin family protein [Alphaproteobacteria bacterium]